MRSDNLAHKQAGGCMRSDKLQLAHITSNFLLVAMVMVAKAVLVVMLVIIVVRVVAEVMVVMGRTDRKDKTEILT